VAAEEVAKVLANLAVVEEVLGSLLVQSALVAAPVTWQGEAAAEPERIECMMPWADQHYVECTLA
jgi:hypothetical protein